MPPKPRLRLAVSLLRAGSGGKVVSSRPLPENDPKQRKPDIARAKALLGWEPRVALEEGLRPTIEWYRARKAILSGAGLER